MSVFYMKEGIRLKIQTFKSEMLDDFKQLTWMFVICAAFSMISSMVMATPMAIDGVHHVTDNILKEGFTSQVGVQEGYHKSNAGRLYCVDGSPSNLSLHEMDKYMDNIPDKVYTRIQEGNWNITLQSDEIRLDSDADNPYTQNGIYAGMCYFETHCIYIHADTSSIKISVLHEVGHAIDEEFGTISDGDEFKQIYDKEKGKFVTLDGSSVEHACSNPAEYFAESFNIYFTNPTLLRICTPQTYLFLDKFVKSNNLV